MVLSLIHISCLSEGSTIDINFTAGSDWTAASSATWLKLNKLTGSAGDITLTAGLLYTSRCV